MLFWSSQLLVAVCLSSTVHAAAASLFSPLPVRHTDNHRLCKAVPGAPGWPSSQDWAHLNSSLDGRLLQPVPPGAVCHPGQPSYDPTECAAVNASWSTYEFHQADPISVDWNQWANDSCLPREGAPCSGRGYPVFVINATEARHVQLGIKFGEPS